MSVSVLRISNGNAQFAYVFSYSETGQEIYESQEIATASDAVDFLAHMASKSWLDRKTYGFLAVDICSHMELWK